jgi:hypothetical protein
MELYEPYEQMDKGEALLRLRLSSKDRLLSMVVSRILPFLVVIVLFLSMVYASITISGIVLAGIVLLAFSTLIVMNARTGTEIDFYPHTIEVFSFKMLGKRKQSIALEEVVAINLEIFEEPRVSGAYYRLVLSNHKRVLLLKLPSPDGVNKERLLLLNKKLEELTGLKVYGDQRFFQ